MSYYIKEGIFPRLNKEAYVCPIIYISKKVYFLVSIKKLMFVLLYQRRYISNKDRSLCLSYYIKEGIFPRLNKEAYVCPIISKKVYFLVSIKKLMLYQRRSIKNPIIKEGIFPRLNKEAYVCPIISKKVYFLVSIKKLMLYQRRSIKNPISKKVYFLVSIKKLMFEGISYSIT